MVVTTSPLVKTCTLQEFWELPEPGDHSKLELINSIFAPRAALWIDEDTYLEPDLMYVSDELKAQMTPGRRTRADIVVEIISPSNAEYDRKTKSDTYQAMGVREMWLVDTEKHRVEVRSFEAGKTAVYEVTDVLRSEVLPK